MDLPSREIDAPLRERVEALRGLDAFAVSLGRPGSLQTSGTADEHTAGTFFTDRRAGSPAAGGCRARRRCAAGGQPRPVRPAAPGHRAAAGFRAPTTRNPSRRCMTMRIYAYSSYV
ncbi:hypothetical protein GCM10010446_04910 [Streptomyces enissocaesilis]|uniref:Uncharacterized protein n=1 Tax=Streptomyces enissocaesilis TaxID=332589 RepID=A0ABN3WPI3_9ACTN